MPRLLSLLALIPMMVAAPACVTTGTHEALQKEHEDLKARYAKLDRENADTILSLEQALTAEKGRVAQLADEKVRLEKNLKALRDEKASLLSDKSRLEAAEAEMQAALDELAARKAAADARVAAFRDLLARFKNLIDSGKLQVKIIDGQMVVELATDILFGSGSANLSRDGKAAITEVTGVLAGIPDRTYQIAGHTDDIPINTSTYRSNWELAYGRAMAVIRTMIDSGMPQTRISAASYAEYRPAASNDTDEGKAQNRRIEIIVVPDLSKLPGAEELKAVGPT